jgi:Fe2+ transport system protein FeoA
MNNRHIHRGMKGRYCNYDHFHRNIHVFRSFNEDVANNFTKLSCASPGRYELFEAYCDRKLRHRLLEMGFVPGEDLAVIDNSSLSGGGGVVIKIKGAKIALSSEVADKILLREKKNN